MRLRAINVRAINGRVTARSAGLTVAAVLAFGSANAPRPVHASDAIFTVGNYPVDARADDAVAAKKTAIADGQKAALRSLLKRLVPVTAYPRLRKLQIA